MFVRYSGNKAAFQAAGLETTYAKSIVFIGGGECIWANGNYYASSAEIQEVVDGFSWFSQISDGTHTAKTNAKDGVITFSAIDPASVEVLVDAYGVKFGLKEEFVKAVNEVLPARIKAIEDDYLKGADKTELQGNIDAVIGTAEDTMESKTIEGLYKRIDEKTSGIASEGVVTDLSNRVKAIEDAPYATTGNVATAKSEVIGTEGDAATVDTVKGAKAFATSAVNTAKTEILGAVEEADAKTIAALNDKIEAVSADAKSYSIAKVEGTDLEALGANVKEAFKLVDEDGTQAGNVIAIYKDSSVKEVNLVDQELQITYILADGTEDTVGIDVSKFLAESEFAEGLQVVNGVVSVKVDPTSEGFLSVSSDGVKVSGITEALDTKIGKEDVMLDFSEATTEVYNLSAENPSTPVLTGNLSIQSFEESHPGGQNVEVVVYDGDTSIFVGTIDSIADTFKCVDGVVTYKRKFIPEDIPATQHTLSGDLTISLADSISTLSLTMNVEKGDKLNTHDSLVYLNNTKADKTEVESSLVLKADKTEVETAISELETKINNVEVPTKVSQLENDENYTSLVLGSKYCDAIEQSTQALGIETYLVNEKEGLIDGQVYFTMKKDIDWGYQPHVIGNVVGLTDTAFQPSSNFIKKAEKVLEVNNTISHNLLYKEGVDFNTIYPNLVEIQHDKTYEINLKSAQELGYVSYSDADSEMYWDGKKSIIKAETDTMLFASIESSDGERYFTIVRESGDIVASYFLDMGNIPYLYGIDFASLDKIEISSSSSTKYTTQQSLTYLNENKADKTEVETTVSSINETLSTKLDASAFEWEEL